MFDANTWDVLSKLGVIAGLTTTLFSLATLLMVYRQKQLLKRYSRNVVERTGDNPAVLVVNLRPGNIDAQVQHFMKKDALLANVPQEMFASYCWQKKPLIDQEDINEILGGIHAKYTELKEKGYDSLSLFYAGPTIIAAMVGAMLSNSRKVRVYQLDKGEKEYKYWGLLEPLHF